MFASAWVNAEQWFLTISRPVGAIIAGWVTYGSAFIDNDDGWRVPVWIQLVTSGIVAIFVWFIPESVCDLQLAI